MPCAAIVILLRRRRCRISCAVPDLAGERRRIGRLDDLHAMLRAHGDWMDLGAAEEKKEPADGTVEAWGRAADNPVGGFYGLRKGYRGRFGMYVPPLMEALGRAELTHEKRGNRMRAI